MIKYHENIDNEIKKKIDSSELNIVCSKGCSTCCENVHISVFPEELNIIVRSLNNLNYKTRNSIAKKINLIDKTWKSSGSISFKSDAIEDIQLFMNNQHKINSYVCPLLQNGICLIYENRPAVCRVYYSSNENLCQSLNADMNYKDVYYKYYTPYISTDNDQIMLPFSLFRNIDFINNKFVNVVKTKYKKQIDNKS